MEYSASYRDVVLEVGKTITKFEQRKTNDEEEEEK